jgi:hypothetical protein
VALLVAEAKRSSPDPGDPPHRDNAGRDRGGACRRVRQNRGFARR